MKLELAAVAVALALIATGAAAAMPGNAPDGAQADEHANDTAEEAADANESDGAGDSDDADEVDEPRGPPAGVPTAAGNETASDGEEPAVRGPPADLPPRVPEFVPEIHDAIRRHLDGSLPGSDLGERIAALVPGGDDGDASAAPNGR